VALGILFKAVAETLKGVSQKTLGGEIGYFSILHTWGGKLEFHPHIHCVVPGVVIKADGSTVKTRDNFFLSKRRLQIVFRAVFLKLLRRAYTSGMLLLHGGGEAQSFVALLHLCAKVQWIVDARKPFAHPELVLKYLARYTHRVAIMNSRIKRYKDGVVTFLYRDKTNGNQQRSCSMELSEFVRRFLLHVLPRQFVRIRHYGFMACGKRTLVLTALRAHLGTLPHTVLAQNVPCCHCCGSTALNRAGKIHFGISKYNNLPLLC
jgi:hypothetical protein